jgi:hypothetical protein
MPVPPGLPAGMTCARQPCSRPRVKQRQPPALLRLRRALTLPSSSSRASSLTSTASRERCQDAAPRTRIRNCSRYGYSVSQHDQIAAASRRCSSRVVACRICSRVPADTIRHVCASPHARCEIGPDHVCGDRYLCSGGLLRRVPDGTYGFRRRAGCSVAPCRARSHDHVDAGSLLQRDCRRCPEAPGVPGDRRIRRSTLSAGNGPAACRAPRRSGRHYRRHHTEHMVSVSSSG